MYLARKKQAYNRQWLSGKNKHVTILKHSTHVSSQQKTGIQQKVAKLEKQTCDNFKT